VLGVISVFLVYKLGGKIFNKNTGLVAAFIFSLDGLNFVQSRTGMNDAYVVTFSLASLLLLLNRKFFLSALFVGFAFASKWSALYLIGLNSLLLFYFLLRGEIVKKTAVKALFFIAVLVPLIYWLSYIPFFKLGHTFDQFINFEALFKCQLYKAPEYFKNGSFTCPHPYTLQNQMLNYHVNLVATHDYSSPAWSWPLNLFPVWYFVEYHKDGSISNIFASGNPVLFWMGVGAIIISLYDLILSLIKRSQNHEELNKETSGISLQDKDRLLIVLLGYFVFWLPWVFSPRIMFLYHYSPSIPFLCLILGYQINLMLNNKGSRGVGITILTLITLGFILVYPMLTGVALPKNYLVKFFDTNLTKNPFAQ
jgi:dolichyl-phosphate-mannose-protein mannosyltransferase